MQFFVQLMNENRLFITKIYLLFIYIYYSFFFTLLYSTF